MTDWESQYSGDDTPWDKGAPAPPLLEWLDRNPGMISGRVLVPGCGLGHDVRALASLSIDIEPVGVDLSKTAIDRAREIPSSGIESYLVADLFRLETAHRSAYDWAWEHTCFCAIEPSQRDKYVASIHTAIKPGGQLLGVFYLDPYDDDHLPGEGPPHGTSVRELETRFAETGLFRVEESYIPEVSYPGREGLEQVMRMTRL